VHKQLCKFPLSLAKLRTFVFFSDMMTKPGIRQAMLIGLMLLLSGTIVKGDAMDVEVNGINDSEEGILSKSDDGKSRV